MRHVYLYVHDLRSSGVVRNAIDFARRLAEDHPTTLVAGYGDGFFAEEAARGPFALKVLAEKEGALGRGAAALRLRAWLSGQPAGALMSVGNMGHWTPFLACQGLRHIARIYCISNEVARDDGLKSRTRLAWMKLLILDAARVVVVGRALRRLPLFAEAIASGRAAELPNGVDNALARRLARAPAPHPWLEEPTPVVVGIGRLRPQKNFDLLIEAVGRARGTRRLRLAIIGGGAASERARLEGLARDAGLGDDFLLAGETGNVFAWLSRAAVFALPSRWETSSLALLEALAAGAPVVASRIAGDAAQVLDEGRYGLLFDGQDPDALAQALLAQTEAPVRPQDRAIAYDLSLTNHAYARLVDEVLAAGTPRRRRAPRMAAAG
ncbi:MAG: glycosyltransferase [Phenylobacterium sp.]|uniref:glycosyltransferase n=1 Tax=Phenylobacterium sp. TaxID=1871053 RepID=UPI00121A9E29|nr:glycosyltransferase [Phenylobacterium sp.]TAJ71336.1 MAG: glycosyltransferase [Phenylobacterium sp.]